MTSLNRISVFLLLFIAGPLFAVAHDRLPGADPPGHPIQCGIWYDYDAAGNRIKRYYDCKDLSTQPDDPASLTKPGRKDSIVVKMMNAEAGNIKVFPNPVTDKFSIRIPGSDARTHFHLYDAKGSIVSSGFIEGELYNGSLALAVPGNYLLVVYFEGKAYNYRITKL